MRTTVDAGRLPCVEVKQLLGGRYELIEQLGNGGMAVVWQARDKVLGRMVAVKLLAGRHAGDPQSRSQIRDEARAAAALSHPNIAQVYDYGESREDGTCTPYVVMELVRGSTLQQRLAAGPVPPGFAIRVAAEVAAALTAAHADGVVHRDIKPANVMVTPAGAKVVDFGIAAAIRSSSPAGSTFEVIGTPAYVAPERLLNDAVEPASDVYALGVLLYRMLSGHSPWSVDTTTQMLEAHVYIDPAPLPQLPNVPGYVIALCDRCLSKDPTLRPSAREAAALLAQGAGLRVIDDEPAQPAAGSAVDGEPSVLIRKETLGASASGPTAFKAGAVDAAAAAVTSVNQALSQASAANPARSFAEATSLTMAAGPTPAPGSMPSTSNNPALDPAGSTRRSAAADAGSAHRHRRTWQGVAVLLLGAAAATMLWVLLSGGDQHRDTASVQPGGASATSVPAAPTSAGQGSGNRSQPGRPADGNSPTASALGANAAGAIAQPGDPAGPDAPVGTPGGTQPTGTDPNTTSTPGGRASPTHTSKPPQERTLSSTGGSVRVTCPSASTAQLLSWTAIKPYKVDQVSAGPGSAPVAVFKHGNRQVRMTVTCSEGIPSTANDES